MLIGELFLLRYQGGPKKYQARPTAVASPAATGRIRPARLRHQPVSSPAASEGCPSAPGSGAAAVVRGNSPVTHARQVGGWPRPTVSTRAAVISQITGARTPSR